MNYWLEKMVSEGKAKELKLSQENPPPLGHTICGDDEGLKSYAFVNELAHHEYIALVMGLSRASALTYAAIHFDKSSKVCKGECGGLFPECQS